MSYLQRIADRLSGRRVTFAQPRPPELTEHEEIVQFSRKYLPVRFIVGIVIIGAALVLVWTIGIIVAIVRGTP